MSAVGAILAGRRRAEALMLGACTIQRPTGQTMNSTTGILTPTFTSLYTGKCKVAERDVEENRDEAGDRLVYQQPRAVHVPMSEIRYQPGDVVTITSSPLDPTLVGVVLLVRSLPKKDFLTARRLVCEEMTA